MESGAHIGLCSVVKANCTIDKKRKVEAEKLYFLQRRKIDGVDTLIWKMHFMLLDLDHSVVMLKPFGEGHINETYAVYMPGEEGDEFVVHFAESQ